MSSRAITSVKTWLVQGGGEMLTPGARFVLVILADESDDQGDAFTCVVSEESLAAITGAGVSTVRRHLAALTDEGVIERVREREPDGTWGGYRTALSLEKLGVERLHRSKRAVVSAPVANPVDNPVDGLWRATAQSTAQIEQPPPILSGPKEVLPSFPPKYSWKAEDHEAAANRILSVAGRGLADWRSDARVLDSLAETLESWLAAFDLEADIVPVVSQRTAHRRKSPLWDLALLTKDLWDHRMARKKREADAPAPSPELGLQRDAKLARDLGQTIKALDEGARPDVLLDVGDRKLTGEARETAFLRKRDELVRRRAALLGEAVMA